MKSKIPVVPRSLPEIQRDYIIKTFKSIEGLKAMIIDKNSSDLISLNFLQSEGFELEVFLFEDIKSIKTEKLPFVSAVYFVNATLENFKLIFAELKEPSFKDYHFFFLTDVSDDVIRNMAELDRQNLIRNLSRFYFNYHAPSPECFYAGSKELKQHSSETLTVSEVNPSEEALLSVFASMRKIPSIRYVRDSAVGLSLAERLGKRLKKLSDNFGSEFELGKAVLLIIERREDAITPLLFHWNYMSLLNELLDIKSNRVKLNDKEYNLSLQHDDFYRENMWSNYGDLAVNLSNKLSALSSRKQQSMEIKQFEDMQRVLSELPQLSKESSTVSKHVGLMNEITHQVSARQLLNVTKIEQDIAARDRSREIMKEAGEIFRTRGPLLSDKFRILALYYLRFQSAEPQLFKSLHDEFFRLPGSEEFLPAFASLQKNYQKSKRNSSLLLPISDKAFQFYKEMFSVG